MSLTYGLNGTPARAKTPKPISIKLIGVGGAGCNAVDRLLEFGLEGVEYLAANTDAQALRRCHAPHQILLGRRSTRGMGTGGNARTGAQAALHGYRDIAHQRLFDAAEPAHEPGQRAPGDTIGQQEVQFLLLHNIHYR